jgi:hypothetical protein
MTITILNLGDSLDVDLASLLAADKTTFKVIDTVALENKRESVYQKITGDQEYPSTVRAGHYINAEANDGVGQTNVSVKVSTFVQKTDIDDVIWTLPGNVTIAWSMPGKSGVPDATQLVEMLNNAISWVIPVVAGVASESALDELQFGVVNGLAAHADTGSA